MKKVKNKSNDRSLKASVLRSGRRALLVLLFAAIASLGVVGAAWAYLISDAGTKYNIFTSQDIAVSIVENDVVMETNTAEVPLGETTKRIGLSIPSMKSDAIVRVTFTPQVVSADSTESTLIYEFFNGGAMQKPVNNQVVFDDITLHFTANWETDWIYKDGFFYYRHILEAGSRTPNLLSGVTTADTTGKTIELVVSAEGMQAHPDEALQEWGVTIG